MLDHVIGASLFGEAGRGGARPSQVVGVSLLSLSLSILARAPWETASRRWPVRVPGNSNSNSNNTTTSTSAANNNSKNINNTQRLEFGVGCTVSSGHLPTDKISNTIIIRRGHENS